MPLLFNPLFIVKKLQIEKFKKYSGYLLGRVLDVGSGTAGFGRYLPEGTDYIGMDEFINVGPDILGKAQDLPFGEEAFDSIICTEVLEHLPEPQHALIEMKRVLKKEGFLYLTVPQEWCLHYEPSDYFRFTRYGIKYLLEKNGFKVLSIERIGGVFSLIGQRISDVSWQLGRNCLKPLLGESWAERISSVLVWVFLIFFYCLAKLGDGINKSDALGWAVLAKK